MQEQQQIIKRPSTFPMFSKYLTLQPITVIDYANQCRKHFDDFNQAFKKRITIELDYARSLQAVSRQLDKYIQPGTEKAISFICSAFKVENQQRAHQAKQLAESLKTQIYQVCYNMAKDQTNIVKKIQKDIKKYVKQYESLRDQLDRHYQNYQKVNKDAEQLLITKNYLKYTSQIPQQKKLKLISKQLFKQIIQYVYRTMDSIKQKKQYQKLYLNSHRNYNQFVRQYNKSTTQDLNQLQTQIRQQIVFQSDCLRKLIVCEVSMFKNIQYDLINISKQMQALDTQKDVEILVQDNQNNLVNMICEVDKVVTNGKEKTQRKSLNNSSDLISTKSNDDDNLLCLKIKQSQIDKGMMAISLKNIQEEIFNVKLINKKNKVFKDIVQNRWKELNGLIKKQQNNTSQEQSKKQNQQQNQKQNSQKQVIQQQKKQQKPVKEQIISQQNSIKLFEQYFKNCPFSKQLLKQRKLQQKSQAINQIHDNFLIITRYINSVWNGQVATLIQLKKKKQSQSPFVFIKKLLQQSHFYRIVSYLFIQNFRIHHQVMIDNIDRVREIGKFINSLLTKCSKQNDVFIIRGLLGLLFTYYWVENNNKKLLFAQNSIYKNSIWKKQDFWDAAIYESSFQQMLSFGPQKGQSIAETVLRQKNIIFSQLASYCHYMIMLGIVSKSVRQIVGRYCRLFEMTDDQNTNLSKMITNTVKQYKQIAATYIKQNKTDSVIQSQ